MPQLENIEAIEKRLWSAADTLRANSNYASNQYFMPVMGLVFLRHAYSRYLAVKDEIIASLPTRGGKTPELTKKDFSKKSAIFLQPKAQFDYLVALKDSDDRAKVIVDSMESIEADYETLAGVLPKKEYRELDNEILGQLLRALNPEELKKVTGDVFGRIYEYFLTQFADQKAHDGGEFFTPVSLVSLIANVLEPKKGTVLDPACGSGGMFVQSARFVEKLHQNPNDKLNFYGLEKNGTTIDLAKMNLAVHGLVGDIKKAITYYEDPHNLFNKADFVMANPPFNVDEIDADKVKNDPRLPFGLPGVNKKGKVSNGNYVWISYFYSYLTEQGRAGFVMSSQASSAGGGEAIVREKLIDTGHVDIMISIRSNFFYTRTVPCELWFFNKAKPAELKDKVLMIDARNVFRKVTRKIYDFSPEQLQNILSIIWLYRGENKRFHNLVAYYQTQTADEAIKSKPVVEAYLVKSLGADELRSTYKEYVAATGDELSLLAKKLQKLIENDYRVLAKSVETDGRREKQRMLKEVEVLKQKAVEQLKSVSYFHHQAQWLTERFPEGKLRDVEGLVKLVDKTELKENDWSLTPGRYVGVAPEEEDPDFDFIETMRVIHTELEGLNDKASDLAIKISENFKKLDI